jgi:hypothetical protein
MPVEIDFISLTIGYVCGVCFCWILCEMLYKEEK